MKIKAELPPWDAYAAYLFDIDGTLLHCTDAVHYFAFCDALTRVAGRPMNLDGVVAHGNTDVGILRDAFALAGVSEALWRPQLRQVQRAMCTQAEQNRDQMNITRMPRVQDILVYLRSRGAVLGVATGNLAGIGRIKLQQADLLHYFDYGMYSDAFETRAEVFAAALEQARRITGDEATVCVIGDTPQDVQAARANGIDVIAVATGVYSHEQLLQERPTRCIHTFDDLLPAGTDARATEK